MAFLEYMNFTYSNVQAIITIYKITNHNTPKTLKAYILDTIQSISLSRSLYATANSANRADRHFLLQLTWNVCTDLQESTTARTTKR